MFVFDVGPEIGCVVGLIHKEDSRDVVGYKSGGLNRVSRRHQHVHVHGSKNKLAYCYPRREGLWVPFSDCEHEISACMHSGIISDNSP